MTDKQKRRKNLQCHFGDDDILTGGYKLNAVHCIPAIIEQSTELDFYMDTGDDIYLLRLQNTPENAIIVKNATKIAPITYIIVRKVLSGNIIEELEAIVSALKSINYAEAKDEEVFRVESLTNHPTQ